MPNLTQIAAAVKTAGKPQNLWNLLIYGDPKTGKSRLAATIAKVPYIRSVHFFTVENGLDTLLTMYREGILTEEQAAKIIVYSIPDTPAHPYAFETISKVITTNIDWVICEPHGRCNCLECADKVVATLAGKPVPTSKVQKYNGQPFNLGKLTRDDVVIVDNMTQVSRSTLAWAMNESNLKDYHDKAGWTEYGPQGRVLSDILSVMQACMNTNFITTAHRMGVDFTASGQRASAEESAKDDSVTTKYFPAIGSKNFSLLAGGFFTHIIYAEMRRNKHEGGSATNYNADILTGSRGGWLIEKEKEMDLSLLFNKLTGG